MTPATEAHPESDSENDFVPTDGHPGRQLQQPGHGRMRLCHSITPATPQGSVEECHALPVETAFDYAAG